VALTGTLVAVYVGSVVLLQTLFRSLTGGESTLAIVASTLAIAALFNPLRRGIQAFIDHRFYGNKYDAAKTLEAFGAKLRDETDLDRLGEELVSVVRGTISRRTPVAAPAASDRREGKVGRNARKSCERSFVTLFVTLGRRSVPRMVGKEVR
jgi:hypothetical protein